MYSKGGMWSCVSFIFLIGGVQGGILLTSPKSRHYTLSKPCHFSWVSLYLTKILPLLNNSSVSLKYIIITLCYRRLNIVTCIGQTERGSRLKDSRFLCFILSFYFTSFSHCYCLLHDSMKRFYICFFRYEI